MSSTQGELIRRIFEEAWSNEDYSVLDAITADTIKFHYHGTTMTTDLPSLPALIGRWRHAFPDLKMKVRHLVEEGDLVAVSLILTGTHSGEWRGMPASGRKVSVEEMMFFRFEGDALVEMWEVFDEAGLQAQVTV